MGRSQFSCADNDTPLRTKRQARKEAEGIVESSTAWALGLGWIPGLGLLAPMGFDQCMIYDVAKCYGVAKFDLKSVLTHLMGLVGSYGGSLAAEIIGCTCPGPGWIAKGLAHGTRAHLIGRAVIEYFESKSSLPD